MVDFSAPQEFNVDLSAPEKADETGARTMPALPRLYDPPPVVAIERDAEIYPPQRHGVVGPRMKPRVW